MHRLRSILMSKRNDKKEMRLYNAKVGSYASMKLWYYYKIQ